MTRREYNESVGIIVNLPNLNMEVDEEWKMFIDSLIRTFPAIYEDDDYDD